MKASIFVLLALVVLTGCSSMSAEECQTARWQEIGYRDGKAGRSPQVINDYAKDCGEVGYSVDHSVWQHAYQQGLRLYCSPDNGYRIGKSGGTYHGVCESELFYKNYQRGMKEYEINLRLDEIYWELNDIELELKNNASPNQYDKKRKELLERKRLLVNERARLIQPAVKYEFTFN